jgi:hypothetical protein
MAKKTAANTKSPKPAAKQAVAKQAAAKQAATKQVAGKKPVGKKPAATAITAQDWAQIYAKAWLDEGFRTLLETDPTRALKQYAEENGLVWTKLVAVPASPGVPASEEPDENCIHLVSCC